MMLAPIDWDNRTIRVEDYYQTWLPIFQEHIKKSVEEGNFQDGRVELARDKNGIVVGIDVYFVPIDTISYINLKSVVLPAGVEFHVGTD